MNDLSDATARRFVLVDRDGTINDEVGHLSAAEDLRLIPGSADAIRRLRSSGLGVVIVTNQADVGRGRLPPEDLERIHARLVELLASDGASVEAILYCPHTPTNGCGCRKPETGMAVEAARRFSFDPADAIVIGDHAGDLAMGRSIGATTFLVLTGHGRRQLEQVEREHLADHVVTDLSEAADIITLGGGPASGSPRPRHRLEASPTKGST